MTVSVTLSLYSLLDYVICPAIRFVVVFSLSVNLDWLVLHLNVVLSGRGKVPAQQSFYNATHDQMSNKQTEKDHYNKNRLRKITTTKTD